MFRERFLYLGALKVLPNKETAPACVCVSSHLENFKIFRIIIRIYCIFSLPAV